MRNFLPTGGRELGRIHRRQLDRDRRRRLFVHSRRLKRRSIESGVRHHDSDLAKAPILVLSSARMTSKVVIAAFICFFPTLANMVPRAHVGESAVRSS